MEVEAISCVFILMMLANAQYFLLLKKQKVEPDDSALLLSAQYQYCELIPYLLLNCFIFIGMSNVLFYHLTQFIIAEIQHFMPLFGLYDICF